jgi:hypothetical protein
VNDPELGTYPVPTQEQVRFVAGIVQGLHVPPPPLPEHPQPLAVVHGMVPRLNTETIAQHSAAATNQLPLN